jgi:hypothetical protein
MLFVCSFPTNLPSNPKMGKRACDACLKAGKFELAALWGRFMCKDVDAEKKLYDGAKAS